MARISDYLGFLVWIASCLATAAIGGAITRTSVGTWYQELIKPPFSPPDWVFTPVWISLFFLMGVSVWLVWRQTGFKRGLAQLTLFAVQLALNVGWSVLFFGMRSIGAALFEILVLWAAIFATILRFHAISRLAAK